MSTITDTITRQVSEQVKRAMKAVNSTRSLPHFDYVPTNGGEPSHRQERVPSPYYTELELSRSSRSSQPSAEQQGRRAEPTQPQPRDEECSTVATIAGGYTKGMTRSAWKAQLRGAQQVLTAGQGPRITVPTMDCLKKLTHPVHDIIPLVHSILGFSGKEVNPTGMIRLPVRFGDKLKFKNLEVDFLVIEVPTAYNVIRGRPTLHKAHIRQALPRDPACNTPLRNLVHDHGVEDCLHHLGDIGVLSMLCSHAKVKTRTEDEFGQRLYDSLTDQRRLSLTYSAACAMSRKERRSSSPLRGRLLTRGLPGDWLDKKPRLFGHYPRARPPQGPVQLSHGPYHTVHGNPTQLSGIIYNHGVKDYLHHLWGVGIVSISRRHPEVKTGAEAMIREFKIKLRPVLVTRGGGGHLTPSFLPNRPMDYGPPLQRFVTEAAPLSVRDRYGPSRPQSMTTSDPQGMTSGLWP
ncbi:LOW QUALITY PROTEIN: hypothetical protein Cgig2_029756 [Carnegiea gigantea]|uniref:Uncharacterized protein n=1 Tax=Carnegiea gigantea TaxID=171969 RepID=A0A9Q1GZ78_9CARY|nr:LOW QUALITY PROTEIN: hypothetical protein Cgig2_029756 [Carnegiea gigantea]